MFAQKMLTTSRKSLLQWLWKDSVGGKKLFYNKYMYTFKYCITGSVDMCGLPKNINFSESERKKQSETETDKEERRKPASYRHQEAKG